MERQKFASILDLLEKMSSEELAELEDQVRSLRSSRKGMDALENFDQSMRDIRQCPHCGSHKVYKHGRDSRGSQRFRCRPPSQGGCGRTFNGRTGTPFARMRKPERWSLFLQALSAGHRSLDDLHEFGEVGVSRRTLWRWRKVVLEALGDDEPKRLKGIVEVDETYFRESFKGSRGWKRGNPPAPRPPRRRGKSSMRGLSWDQVPVVTAVDRHGTSMKQVVGYRDDVGEALRDRIEEGSVLCTDGFSTYKNVARDAAVATHVVLRKGAEPTVNQSLKGHFSLARVNAMHTQLKTFVNRQAKGVSTRYLQGYLKWIQAVRNPALSECLVLNPPSREIFHT